ncbi:hypothetical protein OSTOST_01063, partial [Ostertagia ostertagi]
TSERANNEGSQNRAGPSSSLPRHRPVGPTFSSSKQQSSSLLQNATSGEKEKIGKDRKDQKGRFKKASTPPPLIPPAVPGKRYLPGDIRYKQAMGASELSASSSKPSKEQPSSSKVLSKSDLYPKHVEDRPGSRKTELDRSRSLVKRESNCDFSRSRSHVPRKQHDAQPRERKQERDREHRDRISDREKCHSYNRTYDYDVTDEDDYDSEMDDFIDDSGLDMEELSRQEFEETLK